MGKLLINEPNRNVTISLNGFISFLVHFLFTEETYFTDSTVPHPTESNTAKHNCQKHCCEKKEHRAAQSRAKEGGSSGRPPKKAKSRNKNGCGSKRKNNSVAWPNSSKWKNCVANRNKNITRWKKSAVVGNKSRMKDCVNSRQNSNNNSKTKRRNLSFRKINTFAAKKQNVVALCKERNCDAARRLKKLLINNRKRNFFACKSNHNKLSNFACSRNNKNS